VKQLSAQPMAAPHFAGIPQAFERLADQTSQPQILGGQFFHL